MRRTTSKGGTKVYQCPTCHSEYIQKAIVFGQNSYSCSDCGRWGPWKDRLKAPIEKPFMVFTYRMRPGHRYEGDT